MPQQCSIIFRMRVQDLQLQSSERTARRRFPTRPVTTDASQHGQGHRFLSLGSGPRRARSKQEADEVGFVPAGETGGRYKA